GIIGGSVSPQTIGERLYQYRSPARPRMLGGSLVSEIHREEIIAIHLDTGDTECNRLDREVDRVGLLLYRYRDGILVVLDGEDHRHLPYAGEVERFTEVAL